MPMISSYRRFDHRTETAQYGTYDRLDPLKILQSLNVVVVALPSGLPNSGP